MNGYYFKGFGYRTNNGSTTNYDQQGEVRETFEDANADSKDWLTENGFAGVSYDILEFEVKIYKIINGSTIQTNREEKWLGLRKTSNGDHNTIECSQVHNMPKEESIVYHNFIS